MNPGRFTFFSADDVSYVKNLNMCVLVLGVCLWSGYSEFIALFKAVNLWIGPRFIFEPCS
jgi:hypothetical protein